MKNKMLAAALCLGCLALPVLGTQAKAKKSLPDLKVTKITAANKMVKGQQKLVVTYTIKNIGLAPAPASATSIAVQSTNLVTGEQGCTPLKPNGQYTTSWYCDVHKVGNYKIKVGANYYNAFPETNTMNNQNSISFGFSRSL